MQAVILAAGRGERMDAKVNKVLLPLAGRPIIGYIVNTLRDIGIRDITVVVGFKKEAVMDFLGEAVSYIEQKRRLGTANAVREALRGIDEKESDILVLNGDSSAFYTTEVLQKLLVLHKKKNADITMLTLVKENPIGGRILRWKNGKVMGIVEEKDATKAQINIKEINAGCYLIKRTMLERYLPKIKKSSVTSEYYLTDIIALVAEDGGHIETLRIPSQFWHEVNSLEEYKEAQQLMAKKIFLPSNFFELSHIYFSDLFDDIDYVWEALRRINDYIIEAFKKGRFKTNYGQNIFVGEGTIIEEGAFIKGPAIIGQDCFIGHGAYLRENCLIANNCRIGHGSEIKNSILMPSAVASHLNYVGDSIVGRDVNMGGGSKTANFRLDGETVKVRVDDKIIDTGLVKFGAIIGDGSKIGVNAVLNPGTILGKKCIVYPLTSVTGVHKETSIIK